MIFSNQAAVMAAGGAEGEISGTAEVIDYSHEPLAGWGYSLALSGNEYRYQTFTATQTGELDSVSVAVYKKNAVTAGFIDLQAVLYDVEDGKPVGEPLAESEVKTGDQVNSAPPGSEHVTEDMITEFPLSYQVEEGKQYAVALQSSKVTGSGDDTTGGGQCYDWFASKSALKDGECFGKTSGIDGGLNWVDETSSCGIGWLKVFYAEDTADSVDYTFETTAGGFGFGATGNEWRWQSFTSVKSAPMSSVDIRVTVFDHNEASGLEKAHDLIVALYAVDGEGLPTGEALAQAKVPAEDITSKVPMNVPMQYQLENGVRYAIAMTMETPLSLHGGYDCYGWATQRDLPGAEGEKFGKTNNGSDPDNITSNNWVTEDLGTGYLKVNYGEDPDAPAQPSKVVLEISQTMLNLGDTASFTAKAYDRAGNLLEDAKVTVTSENPEIVSIQGNEIKALKSGNAVITAKSGKASAQVTVVVKDASGMVEPVPGLTITEDVKLKPGTYDFGGASAGLIIAADHITVDGTGVIIRNADPDATREDVTSGAYAYQLNPVAGEKTYSLTRTLHLTDASDITFRYDVKGIACSGVMKLSVSEDDSNWTEVNSYRLENEDWNEVKADLSAYAGKTIRLRLAFVSDEEIAEGTSLRIDTIELKEDGVRTFSDMAEAKVFYWWDAAYGDGSAVADDLKNKPFDRTSYGIPTSAFKGTGILADGVSDVTIKGFTLSGFKNAMYLKNASGLTICENDLSNNYTDPNGGWGDQTGGAMTLEYVSGSTIENNVAFNNANGIYLKHSDGNKIYNNEFAICSDVCLEMWNSSHNDIRSNDFSWGIRIDADQEVHARDSTSQLMESGSNYNYFYKNDFTHGGDGIFIRVGNGWPCEGNVFEENDTSYANNNAVESWAGRNYFIRNKANYSSYGFWLGGSDESDVLYNEVAYNGIKPCNAAERGAGNGGLVFLNGTAEHIRIVGNDVHNNNGSGIAIRYDVSKMPGYVAGHVLIQNNRITGTTKGAGNGDAIYLDSVDWVDVSGNLMEGNVNDGVFQKQNGTYPVTNVTEYDGSYLGDEKAYNAVVPVAKIKADRTEFYTDEEITFSAADSKSPSGKELSYRWSMGDGFGSDATVKTGKEVKFSFDKPGYYDVAVTVTDGTWSDIAWINVNVAAQGAEIGTDADVSEWKISDKLAGKSTFVNETRTKVQEAMIPEVAARADYSTYYTVDGSCSIYLKSNTAANTVGYPAAKNLGKDFSKDKALSLNVKIHDARNWYSANSPTIRLYTDDDNYFTYQAQRTYLSPLNYADLGGGQWRSEWVNLYIPYNGDENWSLSVTGSPSLSDINYIEFTADTSGDGTELWIDGMKSVYTGDVEEYYGPNLSPTGKAVCSDAAEGSDIAKPVSESIDKNARWYAVEGETSWYGVEYSVPRFVDRVELFLSGKSSDSYDVLLPEAYEIQYLSHGEWKPVENPRRPVKIREGQNTVAFDLVEAEALRAVFTQKDNKPVSVYGFKTINSKNYAAETDFTGKAVTIVESSIKMDSVLESVDLVINVNDKSAWPQEYHDFIVYINEAGEDGTSPVGPALAKGVLTKDTITENGFGKIYNIPVESMDGGNMVLKPGHRYVLSTTQESVNPDKVPGQVPGSHYRWAGASGIVSGEYCGKLSDTNADNIQGYPESLGTFWMRVHTDRDEIAEDGSKKAQIDYSWDPLPTGGYGTGHSGEPGRYQTFTMPLDVVTSVIDGKVSEGNGWSTKGQTEDNTLTTTFNQEKTVGSVNIFFEEGSVPEKFTIEAENGLVKEVTDLHAGFNLVHFDEIQTGQMTFTIPAGSLIRELEILPVTDTQEPPAPEKKVEKITVVSQPKAEYELGEALNLDGGRILVDYSDGTQEEIAMTPEMVTGFDSATAGTKTITVTYGGCTAAFTVEVKDKETESVLESIRISRLPDKTNYRTGEKLDLTGMVVEAVYSDGAVNVITDYAVSEYDFSTAGTKTITLTYEGFTAAFTVEVKGQEAEAVLESIRISRQPDKKTYKTGEKLDLTGMVVEAVYSDKTVKVITDYTVSGYDKSKTGEQKVVITYQGKTAEFKVKVTGQSQGGKEPDKNKDKNGVKTGDQTPIGIVMALLLASMCGAGTLYYKKRNRYGK